MAEKETILRSVQPYRYATRSQDDPKIRHSMTPLLAAVNLERTENSDFAGVDRRFASHRQQHG